MSNEVMKETMKLIRAAVKMDADQRASLYQSGRKEYEEKYNRVKGNVMRYRLETLKGELMKAVNENNLIKVSRAVSKIEQEVSSREPSYYERGKNYSEAFSEAFIEASKKGYTKIVSAILEAGVDLNVQDEEGKTALMHASENGYLEIVEELIVCGADVSIADKQGRRPLDAAQKNGFKEIEKLIKGDKEAMQAAEEKIREREPILKGQNPTATRLGQDEIRRKVEARKRMYKEERKVSTHPMTALETVFMKQDKELEYARKKIEKEGLQGLAKLLIAGWDRCRC